MDDGLGQRQPLAVRLNMNGKPGDITQFSFKRPDRDTPNADRTHQPTPRQFLGTNSLVSASSHFQENRALLPSYDASHVNSVQRARPADAQRNNIVLGSRFLSPQQDRSTSSPVESEQQAAHISSTPALHNLSRLPYHVDDHSPESGTLQGAGGFSGISGAQAKLLQSNTTNAFKRLDVNENATAYPTVKPISLRPYQATNVLPYAPTESRTGMHEHDIDQGRQRSISVVSHAYDENEDDIPDAMIRGAKNIMNNKLKLEEQRREIVSLKSQLSTSRTEKEELSQRLATVKAAAKKGMEKSAQSLNELSTTLNDLKQQSQQSFGFASHAQASLDDIKDMRDVVATALEKMEPLLAGDGHLVKTEEVREVLGELQLECSNSQQVSDMLRDRLKSIGAELIDARSRVAELETMQVSDKGALLVAIGDWNATSKQVTELAQCLKQKQGELYDVLAIAAKSESKATALDEEISRLNVLIAQKDADLEAAQDLRQDNTKLATVLHERDARLASLMTVQDELTASKATILELEGTICSLRSLLAAQDKTFSSLQNRLSQTEIQCREDNATIQKLQVDIGASQARENAALRDCERSILDLQQLQKKLETNENKLVDIRRESDLRNEKLQQATMRSQMLEERFDDQSVTLRITKESNGDLQERMITAESNHARDLEAVTGTLNCEIAILNEKNNAAQKQIEETKLASVVLRDEMLSIKAQYEDKLKKQEDSYQLQLTAESQRVMKLDSDLRVSMEKVWVQQEYVSAKTAEIQQLRGDLDKVTMNPVNEGEIRALRSQIQLAESLNKELRKREKTIANRYKVGDLNEEEKHFINSIVQTAQSEHEQELVENGNELRRRENTLKELRSKVHLLESTLAKHVKAQAVTRGIAPVENRSMIDPASWLSSSARSSSPDVQRAQAPDSDDPSTNIDSTAVSSKTPAPTRPAHRLVPIAPEVPSHITPVRFDNAALPAPKTPGPQARVSNAALGPVPAPEHTSNRPMFRQLATRGSDEIMSFDDGPLTPLPVVGKRAQMSSSPSDAAEQSIPRPNKRVRTATRKPEVQSVEAGTSTKSSGTAPKTKTRGKRR